MMFNMKVVELKDKFYMVEEQIRMKNTEIDRLRGGTSDCGQSVATETEILDDTLRSGVTGATQGIETFLKTTVVDIDFLLNIALKQSAGWPQKMFPH